MYNKMKIGILGGIGPEATGMFYLRLIARLQKDGLIKRNTDFPNIIINSINAPELIFERINKKQLLPYINGLKQLENNNVDFIIMVCNTIYLYYDYFQNIINTKIIDLRGLIKERLEKENITKITILGTPNTLKKGLYNFKNINIVNLENKEIKQISKAIFNFNKGVNKNMQIKKCEDIAKKYQDNGSKIILGCTEIAVMLNNKEYLDATDVFIEYVSKTLNKQTIRR